MRFFPLAALMLSLTLVPVYSAHLSAQEFTQPEGQGRLLQQLNLTPDQLQQLKALRQRNQGEIKPLRQQVQQLRKEMEALLIGESSSQEIRTKFSQLQPLQQRIAEMHFEQMLAIREILTPQQRSRLGQLMKQRQEQRGKRFQPQ